jgi:hypothetical protein
LRGPPLSRRELRHRQTRGSLAFSGPSGTIRVEVVEPPKFPDRMPEAVDGGRADLGDDHDSFLEDLRDACERVLNSDGSFAVASSKATPHHYVQWIEFGGGGIHLEIADPAYNDEEPLTEPQLDRVASLGFEKGSVNFDRDFGPGELDPERLAELVLRCFAEVFAVADVSGLELN